jgi:hypothetical protein
MSASFRLFPPPVSAGGELAIGAGVDVVPATVSLGTGVDAALSTVTFGTGADEFCATVVFGTGVDEFCATVVFGTGVDEFCATVVFGTGVDEFCATVVFGTGVDVSAFVAFTGLVVFGCALHSAPKNAHTTTVTLAKLRICTPPISIRSFYTVHSDAGNVQHLLWLPTSRHQTEHRMHMPSGTTRPI